MTNVMTTCPNCGAILVQKGTGNHMAIYHCAACGHNEYVPLGEKESTAYLQRRSALLARIRAGIIDWEIIQWDYIREDTLSLMASYEESRGDIYLKMALIACLTDGFHNLNSEKYKECKAIFKATEKVYKKHCKDKSTDLLGALEYEEHRALYKKCRREYRNEKLAWKAVFFVCKRFIPKI